MSCYVNDRSIQGQFDGNGFEKLMIELSKLAKLRLKPSVPKNSLFVTNTLLDHKIENVKLIKRVMNSQLQKEKKLIEAWLRTAAIMIDNEIDLSTIGKVELKGNDVTNSALGLVSVNNFLGEENTVFSLQGADCMFLVNPLELTYKESDKEPLEIPVQNFVDIIQLETVLTGLDIPDSWSSMIDYVKKRFTNLEFGMLAKNSNFKKIIFDPDISSKAIELLNILNDYVSDFDENGRAGEIAQEIVEQQFGGPRFSLESDSNLSSKSKKLTFKGLDGKNRVVSAHGKLRHREYRLHFDWPYKKKKKEKLEIYYLGPKLTKS